MVAAGGAGAGHTTLLHCASCLTCCHLGCLDPPMKVHPGPGSWICPECVRCFSCGGGPGGPGSAGGTMGGGCEPGAWRYMERDGVRFALCVPCATLVEAGENCPVCVTAFGVGDDSVMVLCECCKMWVVLLMTCTPRAMTIRTFSFFC